MDGRHMVVPDAAAMAQQSKIIEAQKELSAIQFAQQTRQQKAAQAINFILLPTTGKDGIVRQDPEATVESQRARAAAYDFLTEYFSTETDFEAGLPVREVTALGSPVATA